MAYDVYVGEGSVPLRANVFVGALAKSYPSVKSR